MNKNDKIDTISQSLGALFLYAFLVILTGAAIFLGVISLLVSGEILSTGLACFFIVGGTLGTIACVKQIIKENNAHVVKAINYIRNNTEECYDVWLIDTSVWSKYIELNKTETYEAKVFLSVLSTVLSVVIIYLVSNSFLFSAVGIVVGGGVYYTLGVINKKKNEITDADIKLYFHAKAILIGSKFINLGLWGNSLTKVTIGEDTGVKFILFEVERCTGETNVSQFIKIPVPNNVLNQLDDLLKKFAL